MEKVFKKMILCTRRNCSLFLLVVILVLSNRTQAQSTFSVQSIQEASDYSKSVGGSSVLIMQNGEIIFEEYHNGADTNTATHLHSATKLFWSAVAALALEQGLITSYEEFVSNTITEWQNTTLHPGKKLIKIKHLLELSSGLSQNILQAQSDSTVTDLYQYAIDSLNMTSLPGTQFRYGPSHYYVFATLLQRKLHNSNNMMNPLEYLEKEIFDVIGLNYQTWLHDSIGNPRIPNGCYITSRNWIKFGQFMLQKGRWDSTQVIDSNLIKSMFVSNGPNPGHGYFCWLNNQDGYGFSTSDAAPSGSQGGFIYNHGYTDIIGGLGSGKNRMYLIPSLNAVIVRQTLMENDSFDDHTFLSYLLSDIISSKSNLENQDHDVISIYPNPTKGLIRIQPKEFYREYEISVFNMMGEKVIYKRNTSEIDLSSFPFGCYVLKVKTEGLTELQKVLKIE